MSEEVQRFGGNMSCVLYVASKCHLHSQLISVKRSEEVSGWTHHAVSQCGRFRQVQLRGFVEFSRWLKLSNKFPCLSFIFDIFCVVTYVWN